MSSRGRWSLVATRPLEDRWCPAHLCHWRILLRCCRQRIHSAGEPSGPLAELSQRGGLCLPFIDYKEELIVPRADATRCITLAGFWLLRICLNKRLLCLVLIALLRTLMVVRTGFPCALIYWPSVNSQKVINLLALWFWSWTIAKKLGPIWKFTAFLLLAFRNT